MWTGSDGNRMGVVYVIGAQTYLIPKAENFNSIQPSNNQDPQTQSNKKSIGFLYVSLNYFIYIYILTACQIKPPKQLRQYKIITSIKIQH